MNWTFLFSLFRSLPRGFVLATGLCLLLAWTPAARAASLERALMENAKKIVKYCQGQGYQTVGVLKFRVQKGDSAPTDRAGTINMNMAQRLELALILANDGKNPLDIIKNASAAAEKIPGANHLTEEGRQKLFFDKEHNRREDFHLAWKHDGPVAADAFLTGTIKFQPNLKDLVINVVAIDGKGNVAVVTKIEAETRLNTLVESGETFSMRAVNLGREDDMVVKVTREIVDNKPKQVANKFIAKVTDESPVELVILYDNKPISCQIRDGRAEIPEPEQGQKVCFKLIRKDNAFPGNYGVVLTLNGHNLLDEETLPPTQCQKWVLRPNCPEYKLDSFNVDGKSYDFVVKSPEESKANEIKYGENVGQIGFTVFKENFTPEQVEPAASDDNPKAAQNAKVLTNAQHPKDLPDGANEAKEQINKDGTKHLGLVERSQTGTTQELERATLKNPGIISSVTITYYKPQARP